MWFVVKTISGQENAVKDNLLRKVPIVSQVYLPMQYTSYRNRQGKLLYHPHPLISGYLFVDLSVYVTPQSVVRYDADFNQLVWNQLKKNITPRGYFFYRLRVDDSDETLHLHGTRLLSDDPEKTFPADFIRKSLIPDEDMNPFMQFNGSTEYISEETQIIGESFEKLARVNDTVRIVTGPMAGATGVVVSKGQKSKGKNFKDRHLEVRLGNSLCVSYSNIRRFDMVIVREAQFGEKGRDPRLWHEVDYFIGLLQRTGHVNDAPAYLFRTLNWIHNRQKVSLKETMERIKTVVAGDDDRDRLFRLAGDLPFGSGGAKEVLATYVPSIPIRPFLTPAEGDDIYNKVEEVAHKDFKELIIPINLKDVFVAGFHDNDSEVSRQPDDYAYNAHVAVFPDGRAVVSWGRFFDEYAAMDDDRRKGFLADLDKKGYSHLFSLLSTGHPLDNPDSPLISFQKVNGIGGFSIPVIGRQRDAAQFLVDAVAPAAVEMWQKERLRNWRRLLQQYVFINHV